MMIAGIETFTAVTAIWLSMAVAVEAKADAASCPSSIPFGLTTALTGNLALLGTQARNGVEFAVDEINAGGGIAGKKLALTTEDTGASSTDALNAELSSAEQQPDLAEPAALVAVQLPEPLAPVDQGIAADCTSGVDDLNKGISYTR